MERKCRHMPNCLIWGKGDSELLPVKGFGKDFTIKPRHKALVGRPSPKVKVKQVYAWCPNCGALKVDGGWIIPIDRAAINKRIGEGLKEHGGDA